MYLLVFHAHVNEMLGSRSKIPRVVAYIRVYTLYQTNNYTAYLLCCMLII
jgi:hypothetical protein